MPGLAGIIGLRENSMQEIALNKMIQSMRYEKFYGYNTFMDKSLRLAVGWTYFVDERRKKMPIWNEQRNIYVIMTGNIFISDDSINWLKKRGHGLLTSKEAWIVHMYEELGEEIFKKNISGQFAGILTDLRQGMSYIFNDKYGLMRIYYREEGDVIYFSTEAKSLLKIFKDSREIDYIALSERLVCGCILDNNCLFRNINVLRPGTVWAIGNNRNDKQWFYKKQNNILDKKSVSYEDRYQYIKNTLINILPKYFNHEEPIGVSITGGKDTRILLGLTMLPSEKLKFYTFGSIYNQNRDEKIGKIISKLYGLEHTVIRVGEEFFKLFPVLAEKTIFITDGLLDVGGAPCLYVNSKARKMSIVRMTGNYGQEIFDKYIAFKPDLLAEKFLVHEFNRYLIRAYNRYFEEKNSCNIFDFILYKQIPWHHYKMYKLESSQLNIISPFLDNDLIEAMNGGIEGLVDIKDNIRNRLFCETRFLLNDIETDIGYKCKDKSLYRKLLIFIYVMLFKAEYAFDQGMPNWLALINYYLKPFHLDRFFLGRHKYYHLRLWYMKYLSNYIKEILLDKRTFNRPLIDKKMVEKIVNDHTKGIKNYTKEINDLLSIELIYRLFIDE